VVAPFPWYSGCCLPFFFDDLRRVQFRTPLPRLLGSDYPHPFFLQSRHHSRSSPIEALQSSPAPLTLFEPLQQVSVPCPKHPNISPPLTKGAPVNPRASVWKSISLYCSWNTKQRPQSTFFPPPLSPQFIGYVPKGGDPPLFFTDHSPVGTPQHVFPPVETSHFVGVLLKTLQVPITHLIEKWEIGLRDFFL